MTTTQTIAATVLFVYAAMLLVCRLRGLEPHLCSFEGLAEALEAVARWQVRVAGFIRAGVDQYRSLKRRDCPDAELERLGGL